MPIFRHRHHPHLPPPPPAPEERLSFVRAGCSVRISVRVTDGGVALDWTDPNLDLKDVRIWSDARRGLIGRPEWEVDSDDPTVLRATYATSAADLPGTHRLWVDFSYNGWAAAHSVPAYWLLPGLFCSKGEKVAVRECGCEPDIEVRIVLQDVSTTYLQGLIDRMLSLCAGDSERLSAVEQMAQLALVRLDSIAERTTSLEERTTSLEECCGKVSGTLESMANRIADLEERVAALEGGGSGDPDPEPEPDPNPNPDPDPDPDPDPEPEPEPEQVTFAIEVTLAD